MPPSEETPATLDAEQALDLLRAGTIEIEGRLVDASNTTLYCSLSCDGVTTACVYKPVRGERPLWDFPDGTLAGREVAAYLVSEATGWDVVPPTVLRDGPFGTGMCQLWVDVDETVDLAALARSDHPDLRRMAVFDVVVNNADRKGAHVLAMPGGHRHGVDHGLTFHVEHKLRTVLWGWLGERLSEQEQDGVRRVLADTDLHAALAEHVTRVEVAAFDQRCHALLSSDELPSPRDEWPVIPWPPF